MKQKQEAQLEKYLGELSKKQLKPKFSTKLLNYRKVEVHLVKATDYGEAHTTKEKADELEEIETEGWMRRRQQDMNRLEHQFKERKMQELVASEKRLQTGREGGKKQRKIELER